MDKKEGNRRLKPCPICKRRAQFFKTSNGYYAIECTRNGCIVMPAVYERSIEEMVEQWNDRKKR